MVQARDEAVLRRMTPAAVGHNTEGVGVDNAVAAEGRMALAYLR